VRNIAFCAVLAVLLTGCGLTSSPADGLTFTAPSGWESSPGIMGFMQFWSPRSNSDEVLMLFRSPKQIDRAEVLKSGKLQNAQIEQQQQITICGNQAAMYFKGSAQSSTDNHPSKPHHLEMTMTNANGATYFAMYVYPMDRAANAQAESALRELCAKP
jgi:hypothetical protein